MTTPRPSHVQRRQAWKSVYQAAIAVLVLDWFVGQVLGWKATPSTQVFGLLAIVCAALLQRALLSDQLFAAHEARWTLSDARKTAIMDGRSFFDARHVLAFRQRSKASQTAVFSALIVLVPAVVALGHQLQVEMSSLFILALVALALAPTAGAFRLSVGIAGLSLLLAAPANAPISALVTLALTGGGGFLFVTWRQAVSEDRLRFADHQRLPPLSRQHHVVTWGLHFFVVGILAALILPKPYRRQSPTQSDINGEASTSQRGGGGTKKPSPAPAGKEQKSQESADTAQNEKKDEKAGSDDANDSGTDSGQGAGSGSGSGEGSQDGKTTSKSPSGGARQRGIQSNGEAQSGRLKPSPSPHQNIPKKTRPRDLSWMLIIAILFGGLVLVIFGKRRGKDRERPQEVKAPQKLTRRQRDLSRQELMRVLRKVETIPQPDKSTVIALYNALLEHFARVGLPKQPGETPDEVARRWIAGRQTSRDDAIVLTNVFTRAYYGQRDPTDDEFRQFLSASQRLC